MNELNSRVKKIKTIKDLKALKHIEATRELVGVVGRKADLINIERIKEVFPKNYINKKLEYSHIVEDDNTFEIFFINKEIEIIKFYNKVSEVLMLENLLNKYGSKNIEVLYCRRVNHDFVELKILNNTYSIVHNKSKDIKKAEGVLTIKSNSFEFDSIETGYIYNDTLHSTDLLKNKEGVVIGLKMIDISNVHYGNYTFK